MSNKNKVLIYGAGVIGSIYAVKFANAGHEVSVYARGSRLQSLESKGLLYAEKTTIKTVPVTVLSNVDHTTIYDYVFVAVRYEQIEAALTELAENNNPNIVTMVNNPKGYTHWENLIGKGRLIPAFPGAGGKIEDDILHYALTPKIIQTTTFGEVDGTVTDRLRNLAQLFKSSQIPHSVSKNMDAWQKSHLALVIPLANGIYYDGGNTYTTAKNKKAIRMMSITLKDNFNALKTKGIPITPAKLNLFCFCPLWLMQICLKIFCNTKLAETVSSHVPYIKEEMAMLDKEFTEITHTRSFDYSSEGYKYIGNGCKATGADEGWKMSSELFFKCIDCGYFMNGDPNKDDICHCGKLSKDTGFGRFGSVYGDDAIEVYIRI